MSEFKLNYTGQEIQNRLDRIDEIDTLQSRMDTLTSLPEGSTAGDAELIDIRVKVDGTTAPTAGTAVREQISELKGEIANLDSVLYTAQELTEGQQSQARENIAAADAAEVALLEEAVSRIGTPADHRKFAEKVMLYYGYPNAINNSWDVNNSANIYKDYDVCIFGDGYCLPTHEAHAETVEIFRILKRISPDTRIVGYVPIGVQNVGSDSNLSMDELKRRVDLWQSIGADGIFLDEYGYDYGVTRARQNEIVSYCHDRGMFVFANSWSIEYCFSDEDIVIDWMEDFHPNPDGLRAVLNAQDYYVYEHLFYNSYHDGDGNLHVECAEPYRIDNILQYFHNVRIDGKSYREVFGTKVFSLDAIPTGASLREKNEMMSLSIIGAAILNIDAIAFGDDMWSSSGNYHQWDFPQLNLETYRMNSISRSTRTYTDAEGKPAEFTYRWAASINGNQYAIVFDVETPTDVDYVVGKRYAECNGVRVDNAWLTIYDFQEFMDSTAAQVETNTTLVNETVQKVENALPNALQAEEKVNAFMTASDARIEDMESRVNSAISDIEVLTKGFNYLEVEW